MRGIILAKALALITISLLCPLHSALAGIVNFDPARAWRKQEIKVCWLNKGLKFVDCSGQHRSVDSQDVVVRESSRLRSLIREIIEQEYRTDRVGIKFVGWDECPVGRDADLYADVLLRIDAEKDLGSTDGAGNTGGGSVSGGAQIGKCPVDGRDTPARQRRPGAPELGIVIRNRDNWKRALPLDDAIRLTVIHEFGHIAGLDHEDSEIDERYDPFTRRASVYDPVSMMSYRFENLQRENGLEFKQKSGATKLRNDVFVAHLEAINDGEEQVKLRIGLSEGDVHALKCLHVFPDAEREKLCTPSLIPWN